MAETSGVLIHGRCACGKRYRVRNAQAGAIVNCPNCRRVISISEADLRLAAAGEQVVPLQPEQAEALEAVLVDAGELRPAPTGSHVGLTGRAEITHGDAALTTALRGGARMWQETAGAEAGTSGWAGRPFLEDLFISFSLAGKPANGVNLAAGTVMCALPTMVGVMLRPLGASLIVLLIQLALLCFQVLVALYIVQFYWRTLILTACGEDDIPAVAPDWSVWHDAVLPFAWIVAISFLCGVPALVAWWYVPASVPQKPLLLVAAGLAGSLVWPVAVLSAALGDSWVSLRPDWLVRCVSGVGAVYLIAWLVTAVMATALIALSELGQVVARLPLIVGIVYPLASAFANLYLGYVLFRTLGLLYRHFRHRFPWRI